MALTHALSTNNYGEAKLIVATSAANGTHTTLATAMADASVGDTIFLRNSVTENVTITPGVNITAWSGGSANTPSITGTLTMSAAGTSTISGLELITNSAAIIAVTGSAASILNVNNCYLNCTNNTGITYSAANTSSELRIRSCTGDLGTTGIGLFSDSSTGTLTITNTSITNTGGSTTVNTKSAGSISINFSQLSNPLTYSSSSTNSGASRSVIDCSAGNATCLTTSGTGTFNLGFTTLNSGSASAISIGTGTTVLAPSSIVNSTNTNAITGAGTLQAALISFTGSSSTINTTTQTPLIERFGVGRSGTQPAFLAYVNSTINNVTGDSTNYVVIFDVEVYDQGSNFNLGTSTFTAPYTGLYQFNYNVTLTGGTTITSFAATIVTTSLTFQAPGNLSTGSTSQGTARLSGLFAMTAGDTTTFTVSAADTGKTDDVQGVTSSTVRTWASGYLVC